MYLIRTNPRSALLQRRRFDSALRPSPTFRGFSPASSLAAIPRLILPRFAGRLCPQRPFPSPSFSYHR
ncbi:pentatricopeptide repeat-containing protein [Hordeum vulgare]|nr:pentatricopeptide repeat-containing protein [Hordeum vulgare]